MATETQAPESESPPPRETFIAFADRFYPGPLLVAIFLVILAALLTSTSLDPFDQLGVVATGFYELLVVQAAFLFWWVLSPSLVQSGRIGGMLDWIVDRYESAVGLTPTTVIGGTAALALTLGWINWALGIIGGIFIGQKLARRAAEEDVAVHYPLVLMAGLLGLLLANQGLTSSGGLLMSDQLLGTGEIAAETYPGSSGAVGDQITTVENYEGFLWLLGLSEPTSFYGFLLHPSNLLASLVLLVTLPILLTRLGPSEGVTTIEDAGDLIVTDTIRERLAGYTAPDPEDRTFAERAENNRWLSILTGLIGLGALGWYLGTGHEPSLMWLLFGLIAGGMLVHTVPQAYIEQCTNAAGWAVPIGIPFVFYAAVIIMLERAGTFGAIGGLLEGAGVPAVSGYGLGFLVGLAVPDPGTVWLIVGPMLAAAGADIMASLVAVMFASGISNLWLGFLFLGIFAHRIDGFDWLEFFHYATIITVYVSIVVIGSLLVL
ncbi:MAG: TIGR00366 family protein [Natrialbaceae archaeon]|nr:TIGR00366 family protein [Natrialbaceae archaeon]